MPARIYSSSSENIKLAASALKRGEIVAIPTETVYGLAGDVFQTSALLKIFQAKERPHFDPLIAHVAWPTDLKKLSDAGLIDICKLSTERKAQIEKLISAFWPGPLTLVLPKNSQVPDLATSGLETVAIRSPNHSVAQALLNEVQTPLAAPSANRFGRISPTSASDVFAELSDRIDTILDAGRCEVGLESTILHCSSPDFTLLRPGKISKQEIETLLNLEIKTQTHQQDGVVATAPGMLASHYAPRTRLTLFSDFSEILPQAQNQKRALLLFSKKSPIDSHQNFEKIEFLTENGSLIEAAQNLFSKLRALDDFLNSKTDQIYCEKPSLELQNEGLGFAIMDRLKRASHIVN